MSLRGTWHWGLRSYADSPETLREESGAEFPGESRWEGASWQRDWHGQGQGGRRQDGVWVAATVADLK